MIISRRKLLGLMTTAGGLLVFNPQAHGRDAVSLRPAGATRYGTVIGWLSGQFGQQNSYLLCSNPATEAAWPTSGKAIFMPVYLERPITVNAFGIFNAGTIASTFDIGVYDASGNRLISTGSTAQSGSAYVQQRVTVSATVVGPGLVYLGASSDTTGAGTYRELSYANAGCVLGLGLKQATGALPLPNPVTFADSTANYLPPIWMELTED